MMIEEKKIILTGLKLEFIVAMRTQTIFLQFHKDQKLLPSTTTIHSLRCATVVLGEFNYLTSQSSAIQLNY